MKRGNFRSGINQYGSNFGGGNNYYSGGGSFNYQQQNGGYNRPWLSTLRPSPGELTPTCFACGKLGQGLPVPRQEDRSYARKSTDSRRRTSSVYSSAICEPWEDYPPERRKSYQCFRHCDRRVLSWIASALTLFDAGATRFFCFLISSKTGSQLLISGTRFL
jgi:hypothetical protein